MTIELNQHELGILEKALDAYEKDAGNTALFTGMMGAMLTPKDAREEEKRRFASDMEKAERERHDRRMQTTFLRAKLYQAMAKESEHSLERLPE